MKYCSKCGSPINDDAVFCAGCGTRVSDNNTNQNVENLQPTAEPEKVVQPTVEQTVNKEKPNVTNTVPIQQQSVYENIGTAEQKPKKKSKKVLFNTYCGCVGALHNSRHYICTEHILRRCTKGCSNR